MAAVAAWMLRYEIVPVGDGAAAYRLDRWTGQVEMLVMTKRYKLDDAHTERPR